VNGGLFSGSTDTPRFSKIARSYLVHVGGLDWTKINPDIFGSMIQAVADDDERGELGMHYTSVPNILKVLNPLFLDGLREQLVEAGNNPRKLLNLRQRLARIRVFDPACGSGNFLVIAYKELRAIEAVINRAPSRGRAPQRHPPHQLPWHRAPPLFGRDRPPCPDHRRISMRRALSRPKTCHLEFLPLEATNWITCGNALRLDWLSICPPTSKSVKLRADDLFETPLDQAEIDFKNEGGETYICGNPPYKGQSEQTKGQKADLESLFGQSGIGWKNLDYVAGWFFKYAEYQQSTNAKAAFVSTNSICQGQQVLALWPHVFELGVSISFAHISFKWRNLATNNAGVMVVIVGLSSTNSTPPVLFSEDENGAQIKRQVSSIGPYLVPDTKVIVEPSRRPLNRLEPMDYGSKPADGGGLVIKPSDYFSLSDPIAKRFIRRYVGSDDFIDGKLRYCLWVTDADANEARSSAFIQAREEVVKNFRLSSDKAQTRDLAAYPFRFSENRHSEKSSSSLALVVPIHTSEDRKFLPVGALPNGAVVSNAAFALYDAPLWSLAIIASSLHLVWIGTVCGKIKTDFRYSNTLGWNTFPVPPLTDQNKTDLTRCAEDILLAREAHFPATIADLYDPEAMPANLRTAHERNDETLERIYLGRRFKNDTERLEKLFALYTEMTSRQPAAVKKSGFRKATAS
jgi:hypothetical protein